VLPTAPAYRLWHGGEVAENSRRILGDISSQTDFGEYFGDNLIAGKIIPMAMDLWAVTEE